MISLAERVVARYRHAGFIPDKFFKDYAVEFKRLAAEPVQEPLRLVPSLIQDRVIPLYERFIRELTALAPGARQTLQERLSTRKSMLEQLAESYSDSRRAVASPYPTSSVLDHVLSHIELRIMQKLEKELPTLGKALKYQVVIDAGKVKGLANRVLKKTSTEDRAAIESEDGRGPRLERKYAFFQAHVDGSISRLVKKQKVGIDWGTWFSFIRETLEANYTEGVLSEFNLNGMKVVVDDSTVTAEQQGLYVKYMDAAYNLLKKKNLGHAWYGTTFIKCDDCGGVNRNTGGGTGGHYHIRPDTVSVYVRPSRFVTELMVHELGHRYWYKSMSQSQRARFESLVRTRNAPRPQDDVPQSVIMKKVESAKATINIAVENALDVVSKFRFAARDESVEATAGRFERRLTDAAWELKKLTMLAQVANFNGQDAERSRLFTAMTKWVGEAYEYLYTSKAIVGNLPSVPEGVDTYARERALWGEKAETLIRKGASATTDFIDYCVLVGEQRQRENAIVQQKAWDADEREVLPVSDYGRSNIDEAFAEAFAYYVLDLGMTADQKASLKSVLLDKDRMAARVVERWLK